MLLKGEKVFQRILGGDPSAPTQVPLAALLLVLAFPSVLPGLPSLQPCPESPLLCCKPSYLPHPGPPSLLYSAVLVHGGRLALRGGGKKARQNSKSRRSMLDQFNVFGVKSTGMGVRGITKERRTEGPAAHQEMMRDDDDTTHGTHGIGTSQWAKTTGHPPGQAWKPASRQRLQFPKPKVVVDGSNVIKTEGQIRPERFHSLLPYICRMLHCTPAEVLVILDGWVASSLGDVGMNNLRSSGARVRLSSMGVSADARILQSALSLSACVVSNDKYMDYCPYALSAGSRKDPEDNIYNPVLDSPRGDASLVSADEWYWAARHIYRFKVLTDGGWHLYLDPQAKDIPPSSFEGQRSTSVEHRREEWGGVTLPDLASLTLKAEKELDEMRAGRNATAVKGGSAGKEANPPLKPVRIPSARRLQKQARFMQHLDAGRHQKPEKRETEHRLRGGGDAFSYSIHTTMPRLRSGGDAHCKCFKRPMQCLRGGRHGGLGCARVILALNACGALEEAQGGAGKGGLAYALSDWAQQRRPLRGGDAGSDDGFQPLPVEEFNAIREDSVYIGGVWLPRKVKQSKRGKRRDNTQAHDEQEELMLAAQRAESVVHNDDMHAICVRCGRIFQGRGGLEGCAAEGGGRCVPESLSGEERRLCAFKTPEERRAYRREMKVRESAFACMQGNVTVRELSQAEILAEWNMNMFPHEEQEQAAEFLSLSDFAATRVGGGPKEQRSSGKSTGAQDAKQPNRAVTDDGNVDAVVEVFPELSRGLAGLCLKDYGGDAARVVADMIEGNLPPHLAQMHELEKSMGSQVYMKELKVQEGAQDGGESQHAREFALRYALKCEEEDAAYGSAALRALEDKFLEAELHERYERGQVDPVRQKVLDRVKQLVARGQCAEGNVEALFNTLLAKERAAAASAHPNKNARQKQRSEAKSLSDSVRIKAESDRTAGGNTGRNHKKGGSGRTVHKEKWPSQGDTNKKGHPGQGIASILPKEADGTPQPCRKRVEVTGWSTGRGQSVCGG